MSANIIDHKNVVRKAIALGAKLALLQCFQQMISFHGSCILATFCLLLAILELKMRSI